MRKVGTNKYLLRKTDSVRLRDEAHYDSPIAIDGCMFCETKDYDNGVFFKLAPDMKIGYEKVKDSPDLVSESMWRSIFLTSSIIHLDMKSSVWGLKERAGE